MCVINCVFVYIFTYVYCVVLFVQLVAEVGERCSKRITPSKQQAQDIVEPKLVF